MFLLVQRMVVSSGAFSHIHRWLIDGHGDDDDDGDDDDGDDDNDDGKEVEEDNER